MTVAAPTIWQAPATLIALTGIWIGLTWHDPAQVPAAQPVAGSPACSSCDARHARLGDLGTKKVEESE